jgi:hypothetical protein
MIKACRPKPLRTTCNGNPNENYPRQPSTTMMSQIHFRHFLKLVGLNLSYKCGGESQIWLKFILKYDKMPQISKPSNTPDVGIDE